MGQQTDAYLGEIRIFGGNFVPQGWAACDGQLLPLVGNEALYSLIGTAYGGNGTTNFQLPDLRGRAPMHYSNGGTPGIYNDYLIGQRGGVETVTLKLDEIPAHNHPMQAQNLSGNTDSVSGAIIAQPQADLYTAYVADRVETYNTVGVSSAGLSHAHDNMQPYLPVTFIIATVGQYPPRN